jgi:hypothetical protein
MNGMGKRMSEIIERFIEEAGKQDAKFYSDRHLEGIEQGHLNGNDTIFSYGHHFPLAEVIPVNGNKRGWWLLNGDRYRGSGGWGQSTSSQQTEIQQLVKSTGLPFLIVPFSALDQAGIDHNSIEIVDQLPERYTWETRKRAEAPSEWEAGGSTSAMDSVRNWQEMPGGGWSYEAKVHHLGESVFRAHYTYWHRDPVYLDLETHIRVHPAGEYVSGTGYFLSAFDENEPGFGLYFLAQLPVNAEPVTVAEAREALKPEAVKHAELEHLEVLRQGDVFAIAQPGVKTGNLTGPSERKAFVLGVNHQVTEVRTEYGNTYGRGVMRHKPREWGRRPEHRALKLGDGKTWYALYKNTVPEGRSWSVGGQVD